MADALEVINSNVCTVINAVNRLNERIASTNQNVERINLKVENIDYRLNETKKDLQELTKMFVSFVIEQRRSAALQRALIEIVRVRQELEQNFGTNKLVRDNMMGILQATDLALITESTISRCTEELMISAPKYWLAPCLIALAAWISNNEALAKRAIAEACKRDREKTCLLFALITRRVNAGRIKAGKPSTNTTFEWLNEYFKLQNPNKMKRSIVSFVDAYSNGVFGDDKEHICSEQIKHWMDVIIGNNADFADEQRQYWFGVFESYDSSISYNTLKSVSPQYGAMLDYLKRIDASQRPDGIKAELYKINNVEVDTDKLIKDIDTQLSLLVSNYDEDEAPLRSEEERLELIKELKGDEEKADEIIKKRRALEEWFGQEVDFVKRLRVSITDTSGSVTDSEKHTAMQLLAPYISKAFNEFMLEKKDAYPENIDLKINNDGIQINGVENTGVVAAKKSIAWVGHTSDCSNREELVQSLKDEYAKMMKDRIASVSDEEAIQKNKFKFSWIFLIPILVDKSKSKKMLAENEAARAKIKQFYEKASATSVAILNKALDEREAANKVVGEFLADETNEEIDFNKEAV